MVVAPHICTTIEGTDLPDEIASDTVLHGIAMEGVKPPPLPPPQENEPSAYSGDADVDASGHMPLPKVPAHILAKWWSDGAFCPSAKHSL